MANSPQKKNIGFGTLPVFLTALSTILGAILFLRFGWAVGNLGFIGVLAIIVLGHLITIPTAMAVAEISTNQKVLGGGAYYIISRSFGFNIGGAVGIALYVSQAISVAFYIIAFAEAFDPVIAYINNSFGINITDKRFISLPAMAILSWIILKKGANLGMKTLYFVCLLLFVAIGMFLFGTPKNPPESFNFSTTVNEPKNFFYVFMIIFPAFTGLAAGLGLSGDLKNPQKSIPRGTILATIVGLVVYLFIAYKFVISATPEGLNDNQLIMSDIAIWGPIIPIGLAAATLSSALGSILVAPRTLQAIGMDDIFPQSAMNRWFAKVKPHNNEPVNASILTIIIAFFFIIIGDVNFVAQIISMFFMITYGAICTISFLEHFAADISYRPTFRSKWYFSLLGALLSIWIIFQMDSTLAIISLIIMAILYFSITYKRKEKRGLAKLFRGVIFQLNRHLQLISQKVEKGQRSISWRPFAVCISEDSFKRRYAFDFLRWLSLKYGYASYIHFIKGYLNDETHTKSKEVLDSLIHFASGSKSYVHLDTIISPSMTSALAQAMQLSGITGTGYNMILFEFYSKELKSLNYALENYELIESTRFDVCILNTSYKGYGYKKSIHIWISPKDYENANLMILLSYIIMGHPEWKKGKIKIFVAFTEQEKELKLKELKNLIISGRIPISLKNIELVSYDGEHHLKQEILRLSIDADFCILGFNNNNVTEDGIDYFTGFKDMCNILFVNSYKEKEIK